MQFQTVGECIRANREARQWSLQDLADRTGFSRKLIHNYEKGHVKNIPSNSIIKLAQAFGVAPGELYPKKTAPKKEPASV